MMALVGAGALYAALPRTLIVGGPRWLLLLSVVALIVPAEVAHRRGNQGLNQIVGYLLNGLVTLALIGSVALLIQALPEHRVPPHELLRSAAALWVTNILIFASWYWRLDGGGPHERARTPGHTDGAFLFPQMTMDPEAKKAAGEHEWEPNFVDYLFLAFNTSTALSPTDVPALSRWAKVLMMIQAVISLLVVVLLAARAVNIL
jgi:protein-S-isoprenylcysteine O-methyltransferase Ste14